MDKDAELNESLLEKDQNLVKTSFAINNHDNHLTNMTFLSSNWHYYTTNPPSIIYIPKVYWGTALMCSFIWGTSNFIYGLLHDKGFAVVCLSWTGFITSGLIYKLYMLFTLSPHLNRHTIHDSFFGEVRKRGNNIHVTIRSINFFLLIWIAILMAENTQAAGINQGVIACIFCLSSVIQGYAFYWLFGEKFSKHFILSMIMILTGIMIIVVEDNHLLYNSMELSPVKKSESDKINCKYTAIVLAFLAAFMNTVRVIQAKHLQKKRGYDPVQFLNDSALVCGVFMLAISGYFYMIQHPAYTLKNFFISFIASTLMHLCTMMGIIATVRGQPGPASAIIYSNSVFSLFHIIVFIGLIPTIYQFLGMGLTIFGVFVMMIIK
ncbi:UNKNOWN [Stylonychia lemnae]|uniref:EamA domain-containing protein n=1 Tax=Stylonychia lemnae TaxID=5949 RepID=A0A078B7B7_STYLE|nr:UNKNOWN [Stylonychia lemnae]|eukprot:CDW90101.1 UNKNOWN [Stylonychia lemnae]